MSRAAIYTRLSREDIDSGESVSRSIKNQQSMLVQYARGRGWEIYDIYCDDDYSGAYSGADNIRPAFNRMIADAEGGRFDIVLCKSQSRFSRNMEVVEQYVHGKFTEWGIRFISLVDNADTDIKGNKKSRQINSLVNEWYLEDLSENIRAVYRHKMELGEFLAAFPPYGYSKDPNRKNHLVINPDTAPTIKQIFEWYTEGFGASKISRMLNDREIPCPRKQQEIDGIRKRRIYSRDDMGTWSAASVSDILHNQVYCGDVVQHTVEKMSYKSRKRRRLASDEWIVKKDMHEPVISRQMFDATQKRLAAKRKATGKGKVHILSGKVFCHYCGKPMQKNNGKGGCEYLRCRDKYAYSDKGRCPTPNIRIDAILEALSMEFIKKCADTAAENIGGNIIADLLKEGRSNLKNEYENLRNEIVKLERKQKNLYSDRLDDIITPEEYSAWNRELSVRKNFILSRIEEIETELGADSSETGEIRKEFTELLKTKNIDRELVSSLVDRMEFGEINEENGLPMLKIYWALN